MNMKLAPKTLTGVLNSQNKGAFDWGWQGLIAYGCQSLVVVVDPKSIQVLQTLDRHRTNVCKVKWARENYHHDVANPYSLRLASADISGRIVVWDVCTATVRAQFADGNRPIAEMEWLSTQDVSHDLLVALHPPYSVILWNADTGQKLWKKTYTVDLHTFVFDPFEPSKMAFLGQECILFVEDFSISKVPSSNGKRFYISSPSQAESAPGNNNGGNNGNPPERRQSKTTLGKRMSKILVGDQQGKKNNEDESVALNECLQLVYHQACRHHLILVYSREILIIDLDINQTVGIIPMERTGSPFVQIITCRQRDAVLCLHENGAVTFRVRRRANTLGSPAIDPAASFGGSEDSMLHSPDVAYDLRCQSDPLRVTKHSKVFGIVTCPIGEQSAALLMSDSRLLLWQLKTVDYQDNVAVTNQMSPLYTPGYSHGFDFPPLDSGLPITSNVPYPKLVLGDMIGQSQAFVMEHQNARPKHGILLKFVLTGLLSGVAPPPLVIRMCPPLTTKNWNVYQPLVAQGTQAGTVQVYNLSSGQLWREYNYHSCAVRGIEWVSLNSFLSWAFPAPSPTTGTVKNELLMVDIQTGKTTQFRQNRDEESPIEGVKISQLKQYFVIVFKEKPFELWDLRSGTLLREMPRNFPHVTALEWSPSHNLKSLKKKAPPDASSSSNSTSVDLSASNMDPVTRSDSKTSLLMGVQAREHFVFTDQDGLLYHFIVEGNMIKDGSKIPPDGGMGSITCIAWKGDTMVLGDVDGNLNLWDLKARVSRPVPTHRGWVKKVKFAPGRGNQKLLVLYNDGLDIWDAKDVELVSTIRNSKEIGRITDVDWAASDKPVMATMEGCIRVMDLKLKQCCSPIEETILTEKVFSPHMLPPKASMTLKYLLQHQPWNKEYSLQLEGLSEENIEIQMLVNEQLEIMDSDLKNYLPHCQFGTAQRCLLTARLFGDEAELNFWTVTLHYLRAEKAEPMSKQLDVRRVSSTEGGDLFIPTTPAKETNDLLQFDDNKKEDGKESRCHLMRDKPLETCYDVLCDNSSFQKYQLDRLALHDSKRSTYEHTRKCAEALMLLGQTDRAVQLLLETEPDNPNYYVDSLRACLVASIRSSGASQSTIKLVATNLIANGKLSEGVQQLCLIDKGLDACRYLQTYGEWYQAAWLAKSTLTFSECAEVMKRWADHLCSPMVNQKSKAILVMLSLGQFYRVVEMLYGMRHFDQAALFVESCFEFGLLKLTEETTPLVEAVFLEYARLLMNLGNRRGSEYYCLKAGDKGQQLLKEVQFLFD